MFTFDAIGIINSCFKEKFGIPRQPGLVPLARAELELLPPYNTLSALEGLEGSSHLWVQFVFHANWREASLSHDASPSEISKQRESSPVREISNGHETSISPKTWKPKVKPPRLGGNKTLGVFATRSPNRPVPIGLSVVKLEGFYERDGKVFLSLSGVDLLDGTPVLDIKPYIPYTDCVPNASNTFADTPPVWVDVQFTVEVVEFCIDYRRKAGIELETLIQQILRQDPRPSYQQPDPNRSYGMRLLDLDVQWQYRPADGGQSILVTAIIPQT